MSLNEPNNGQDPWAKPGAKKPEQQGSSSPNAPQDEPKAKNDTSPPDLEEVFGNLLKKMGGGKPANHKPSPSMGKLLPLVAVIGAVVWAASGFYTIKEAERGVITRFGQLHHIEMPGLNWKPTFIDEVIPINIQRVSELTTNGSMLTQDENMVLVEMTVQYRIEDPAKYQFNVKNPDDSLKQATDSALRYVIGHMTMDDILTTGRAIVREKTWAALNEIIKSYDMGLLVTDVNFQYARPPEEVKAAFDDAIKAQEDEQRLIREADAYARGREPIARGEAQRIIQQATAYKEQVVLDAQGEVERLAKLLPEYKAAPAMTRERLYIETMEKVMANTPKVMVDNTSGQNLSVLPLDKLWGTVSTPAALNQPTNQPSMPIIEQPQPSTAPAEQEDGERRGRF